MIQSSFGMILWRDNISLDVCHTVPMTLTAKVVFLPALQLPIVVTLQICDVHRPPVAMVAVFEEIDQLVCRLVWM